MQNSNYSANYNSEILSIFSILKQGSNEVLIEDEFIKKLKRSQIKGIPLIIKLGLDPTAPDIHIGHTIVLNKLRQFQDLGHVINLLIGDFTSIIGDPSGRNSTRPLLTKEQIKINSETYYDQIQKILNPKFLKILYNSTWYNKLGSYEIINLSSHYTIARMIERQDFSNRFRKNIPIFIHEFLYPLIQGYDSVEIKADVEIGGTDQKFNLLVGRELQKEYGQEPQCVMTMPLLVGTDGIEKMSKSKNNYIGISESPDSMFGKLMSISDSLMWKYYDLLSFKSIKELKILKHEIQNGKNPKDAKVALAKELIQRFHNAKLAEKAEENFNAQFCSGLVPQNILEINLGYAPMNIVKILKESGLSSSNSEAQRNIQQGGIRIDNQRINDRSLCLNAGTYVVQLGKRKFVRVNLI
ncbi:MAG: tyrosine--tRNA ligase [Bordetella sp.]|nr:MAG: tyrosine--tRNA ligase [Bordetella sp.]